MMEISTNLIILFLVLLTILVTISALCLYKIRRIHIATFLLKADATAIRKETESLFSQTQALSALERKLALSQALPPMRGWAGSPDFLLELSEAVTNRKPQCVMECSSGVSTVVAARSLQLNGNGHVYSLEHDPVYAEKTRKLIDRYALSEWATVIDAPLVVGGDGLLWYSEKAIPSSLLPIELLVIDGPPIVSAPLARYPALPRLFSRLSSNFMVMLDDANRDDEVNSVMKWQKQYPFLKKIDIYCEKGLAVLEN